MRTPLVNDPAQITRVAGYVMAAAALGSIISASWQKLADRIGHFMYYHAGTSYSRFLLIPQAFVTSGWQLIILRFLMGLALGDCCLALRQ